MKNRHKTVILTLLSALLPLATMAQDSSIRGLHGVLDELYSEMMPLCSQLISVAQGLAAFGAIWYIASRVWRSIANAEPIDFYPLFRPFVIGFCIMIFPSVLAMINGVMQPTVSATTAMVDNSNAAIERLLERKTQAIKSGSLGQIYGGARESGDLDKWLKYTEGLPEDSPDPEQGLWERLGSNFAFAGAKFSFLVKNQIKEILSNILEILFEAAALCINTLRTFQLIVLSILGPLVFGLSVFDGFQHTLTVWLARYINIYLWLPVANIFGAIIGTIQEKMLLLDIGQINNSGDTMFTAADTGYLIFLIIGIIGYFTVPSVANYIIHAASGGALPHKATGFFTQGAISTVSMAGTAAGMATKGPSMSKDSYGDKAGNMNQSMASRGTSSGYFNEGNDYQSGKLKGNS